MAFTVAIFVIVLDYFVGYIQEEYAAKRPRLESWGLNTDSWLGSVHHSRIRDTSLIADSAMLEASRLQEAQPNLGNDFLAFRKADTVEMSEGEGNFIARETFNDFLSPKEESIRLMTRVEKFLVDDSSISSQRLSNLSQDAGGLSPDYLAAMKAISSQLMINFDGTMKPITFRQRLFYRDRQDLIEKKLAVARIKAVGICKTIDDMEVYDDNLKDIALMRSFILEQVSAVYRFSLRKNFMDIDGVPPEIIRPSLWLMAWILTICVLLFFLYWIFAWGIRNGGATLNQWGTSYGIAILQDITICEIGKVFVMYIFAVMSAKPQLQVIKRVINDRALSLVQDGADFNDNVSVVQHFSPSCRAARLSGLSKLSASSVLRTISDADVEKCKEHKNFTLGTIIFYTIMIAAVIAAVSEVFVDQSLTFVMQSSLLAFLLLHSKLLAISPILLVVIYAVIGGVILYHLCIFVPSVKRARQARAKRAQAAREFARSKSKRHRDNHTDTVGYDIMRGSRVLTTRMVEYTGLWHTLIFYGSSESRKEIERYKALLWCGMNKGTTVQGYIIAKTHTPTMQPSERANFGRNVGTHSIEYVIPATILKMRQTGGTFRKEETVRVGDEILASGSSDDASDMSWTMPIVQATRNPGILARTYQANVEITTDPYIALKRMLQRHLLGSESHMNGEECSVFDIDDASNDFISMLELSELLSWCWTTFYPGGQELSDRVKAEVDELFQRWRKSPLRRHSNSTVCTGNMTGIWGANFSDFSCWFLATCRKIENHCAPTKQHYHATIFPTSSRISRIEHMTTFESDCDSSISGQSLDYSDSKYD